MACARLGEPIALVGLAAVLLEVAAVVSLVVMLAVDPSAQDIGWPFIFWAAGIFVGVATLVLSAFRRSVAARLLAVGALTIALGLLAWALGQME